MVAASSCDCLTNPHPHLNLTDLKYKIRVRQKQILAGSITSLAYNYIACMCFPWQHVTVKVCHTKCINLCVINATEMWTAVGPKVTSRPALEVKTYIRHRTGLHRRFLWGRTVISSTTPFNPNSISHCLLPHTHKRNHLTLTKRKRGSY